ncbi:MAG: hypothetical protein ACUVRS_10445 [Armatimonadota bacterium]
MSAIIIEDILHNTLPLCTVTSVERSRSISEVKSLDDAALVVVPGVLVSACYDAFFYVESIDRVSAIRVEQENHGRRVGERVDVRGVVRTTASGERYIEASSVTLTTS